MLVMLQHREADREFNVCSGRWDAEKIVKVLYHVITLSLISCYGFSNYKTLASDWQTQLEFQDNVMIRSKCSKV